MLMVWVDGDEVGFARQTITRSNLLHLICDFATWAALERVQLQLNVRWCTNFRKYSALLLHFIAIMDFDDEDQTIHVQPQPEMRYASINGFVIRECIGEGGFSR